MLDLSGRVAYSAGLRKAYSTADCTVKVPDLSDTVRYTRGLCGGGHPGYITWLCSLLSQSALDHCPQWYGSGRPGLAGLRPAEPTAETKRVR